MLLWLLVRARGVTVVQGVHECVRACVFFDNGMHDYIKGRYINWPIDFPLHEMPCIIRDSELSATPH